MAAEKKAGRLSLGAGRLVARNFEEVGREDRTVKVGKMHAKSYFFLRLFILFYSFASSFRIFSYNMLQCFTPFACLLHQLITKQAEYKD